jgi:hypothetical protein
MDPHQNEFAAAVAAMKETYGSPVNRQIPADGDFVSGRTCGRTWSGHVEWVEDEGHYMCINVGGGWLNVPVSDITH